MSEDLEIVNIPNTPFQYSMVSPENLTATQYTLAPFVVDTSGSVAGYKDDLIKALNTAIDACRKSPTAENILVRTIAFNDSITEVHGFTELSKIKDYTESDLDTQGCTSLYDAIYSAIGATVDYAKKLQDNFYSVNAIMFIITDGMDNRSTYKASNIADLVKSIVQKEQVGFMNIVLVGINESQNVKMYLDDFKKEANIGQYISIGDATPAKFAHLGGLISKSVSSSSQSLANGTPQASNLTF